MHQIIKTGTTSVTYGLIPHKNVGWLHVRAAWSIIPTLLYASKKLGFPHWPSLQISKFLLWRWWQTVPSFAAPPIHIISKYEHIWLWHTKLMWLRHQHIQRLNSTNDAAFCKGTLMMYFWCLVITLSVPTAFTICKLRPPYATHNFIVTFIYLQPLILKDVVQILA